MIIKMVDYIKEFGENKDIARKIRIEKILPILSQNEEITIDFLNISGVTQSFIHALLADAIRKFPEKCFEKIIFKNCNENVKTIIVIVEEYMQESMNGY